MWWKHSSYRNVWKGKSIGTKKLSSLYILLFFLFLLFNVAARCKFLICSFFLRKLYVFGLNIHFTGTNYISDPILKELILRYKFKVNWF